MKIAVISDTHCGIRNSSDIFIAYQERFYNEVFFPYLLENGITNIMHLGDYYDHRKYINFKALNSNRHVFLDKLKQYGITMDIIPGNHDVFFKNTNELCSLKELMGYYTNNVNIIMSPRVMDYDGLRVAMLPWMNVDNYHDSMKFIEKCDADWLGAHLELSGFELMKGVMNTHGMEIEAFKRFETVLTGHFHTKSTRENINYLGSQMEFTWADAGDNKYFHIIDTKTRELTPIRNPLTMFEKVLYDDKQMDYNSQYDTTKLQDKFVKVVVVNKSDPYLFDKFIDKIQNSGPHELKIAETFNEFMGENIEDESISVEDTTQLLDSYIEAVDTELDKDRMKGFMREIYVEACNEEIV
jgi:DNA repair exonuclease SbcCD nuclease subunit